jgi:hypothetical protein
MGTVRVMVMVRVRVARDAPTTAAKYQQQHQQYDGQDCCNGHAYGYPLPELPTLHFPRGGLLPVHVVHG